MPVTDLPVAIADWVYWKLERKLRHAFQGSSSLLDPWKMGPISCLKTSRTNYQSVLRKIPEEHRSHLCFGRSLTSCIGRSLFLFSFCGWCGPGSAIGIVSAYGLDGPGIESWWGENFRTYPDQPRGPPSILYNGYQVFPGAKVGWGVMLTTHPHLVPRSWKS